MAAATEISVDVAVVAVFLELNDTFTLEEEERVAQRAFLTGKDVFASPLTDFSWLIAYHPSHQ